MGFLSLFGFKKAPSDKERRKMLPTLRSFIDVAVRNGPKGSLCFEDCGVSTFVTTLLPGMAPGQHAIFNYTNSNGRYRFKAQLKAVGSHQATFDIPTDIEALETFAAARKRTNARIDATVPIKWRYHATGQIESEWQKGALSDLSRTGSSLTTDKAIKTGTILELKIPLDSSGVPVQTRAEARRCDAIEGTTKYDVGLSFHQIAPAADAAILAFINRRQTDLRNRGLG